MGILRKLFSMFTTKPQQIPVHHKKPICDYNCTTVYITKDKEQEIHELNLKILQLKLILLLERIESKKTKEQLFDIQQHTLNITNKIQSLLTMGENIPFSHISRYSEALINASANRLVQCAQTTYYGVPDRLVLADILLLDEVKRHIEELSRAATELNYLRKQ